MVSSLRSSRLAGWHRYGFAFLAAFLVGRLPAALETLWRLLPDEVQDLWPAASFLMGLLAVATLVPGGSGGGRRGRRLRLWLGTACTLLGCAALGWVHVDHAVGMEGPAGSGTSRTITVLVGSQDLPETCRRDDPEVRSVKKLVELNSSRAAINACWGARRMWWVRAFAILAHFLTAAGLGILVGVACARRYEPLVEPEGTEIFLSYSTEDEEAAASLAQALSAAGVKVFYAPESIRSSQSFPKRIEEAIGACRVGVLLWSAAAERSAWVTKERSMLTLRNVEQRVPLQVVRLEEREVPLALRDLHRIDAFAEWRPVEIAAAILRDTGVEAALRREGSGPPPASS